MHQMPNSNSSSRAFVNYSLATSNLVSNPQQLQQFNSNNAQLSITNLSILDGLAVKNLQNLNRTLEEILRLSSLDQQKPAQLIFWYKEFLQKLQHYQRKLEEVRLDWESKAVCFVSKTHLCIAQD